MAQRLNHSLHARKSHVFRESLCSSSFIFFKNISLCRMVNFQEKIQIIVLEKYGCAVCCTQENEWIQSPEKYTSLYR